MNHSLLFNTSYINGQFIAPINECFSVINPATHKIIAQVSEVTQQQVDDCIILANKAFSHWSLTTYQERAAYLMRWQALLHLHCDDLAYILTLEQGKPLIEAKNEILHSADYLKVYANQEEYFKTTSSIPSSLTHQFQVYKNPLGVVSAITPWNFPCSMVIRKAGAILAAGCCCVLKPSELTPLTALALAQLASLAGIPEGVFNVITTSQPKKMAQALTTHPKIAKLSFTGSTSVGKKLLIQCAQGVKRTTMELGGNAPFIVCSDANLSEAVKGAMNAKFRNSGQTCVAANRFIIHESIYSSFLTLLLKVVQSLQLGNGFDPKTTLGPLIHSNAGDKIRALLADAISKGARYLWGEESEKKTNCSSWFPATIIENVTPNMAIFKEEIFGPVISLMKYSDFNTAIQLANQTSQGLCAYIYTQDKNKIQIAQSQLYVGMLGINEGKLSNSYAPFGGLKESGMGREGGHYGIDEYCDYRYICQALKNTA
jgi:succinate-semialdehyde dehydrogenase/glutarate-semialdehyde dehydrogenase